jgi:hypothetical protein
MGAGGLEGDAPVSRADEFASGTDSGEESS